MANTKLGGLKTARTNKRKYGRNYYKNIAPLASKAYMEQPAYERKPRGFAYLLATGQMDKLKQISSDAAKMQKRGPAKEASW